MGALGIELALSSFCHTYLEDEPSREAEDALEAFFRLLLKKYPSLRRMIVNLVETQAWNETLLKEAHQHLTDRPDTLELVDFHERDRRVSPMRDVESETASEDTPLVSRPSRRQKPARPAKMVSSRDARSALSNGNAPTRHTTRNMTPGPSLEAADSESEPEPTIAGDTGLMTSLAARSAGPFLETPESEPELSPVGDGSLTTSRPSAEPADSESESEPSTSGDTTVVTRLASLCAGPFMGTTESEPELSPVRSGRKAIEMPTRDTRTPTEATDPETASEPSLAREKASDVRNGEKRQSSGQLQIRMQKRIRLDKAGADMAVGYANLHYLCFVFSRALRSRRRSQQIETVPSDKASFKERFNAIRFLGFQRELRKLQSTYLSTGLAKEWAQMADRHAANPRSRKPSDNPRQNLVPRDAAQTLVGEVSESELERYRKNVSRWQIFERTRRLFQEELGEQAIIAVFAFPNSTCGRLSHTVLPV